MPAPLLMIAASFLFASMGVCVKLATEFYSASEIVMYRGLVGVVLMALLARHQGLSLATPVPAMHFWRSASGVLALSLWFYAIGGLPLATAMTLNYMSSVWMALFLIGGAIMLGSARVDGRLVAAVLLGFLGVIFILRPTLEQQQLWHGLAGLLSGMLAAMAYLQVTALGRAGEPEIRIVFYFSLGGVLAGALISSLGSSWHTHHSLGGMGLLLAVGLLASTAQLMMTRAYGTGSTLVNASLQYLGIVFSFIYGVAVFQDRLSWSALLGMGMIVGAGLAATALRNRSTPKDSQQSLRES
ncbi:MAG: DMT family transporter [Roseateles asaccharophilus]|uniref:S-adenosylmethionine uptake transporter n=1 Tax=Roseateles asaccharophilus TaxID=582607 RepID=A0A4R6N8L4_9BURK|nr:DMT family transporter [Roseateles asaccharophilus]MDN3543946.1 DMT family transporter [Roseateles asaccharophilus]TDP11675.1 S-adenosylmethionine uptake transporter [Roseateles asaccharophilus]